MRLDHEQEQGGAIWHVLVERSATRSHASILLDQNGGHASVGLWTAQTQAKPGEGRSGIRFGAAVPETLHLGRTARCVFRRSEARYRNTSRTQRRDWQEEGFFSRSSWQGVRYL